MKVLARRRLQAAPDVVETTIVLKGTQEAIDQVEKILSLLIFAGNVGHSGIFGVGFDGDGSHRLDAVKGVDPKKYSKIAQELCSYGGDVEVINSADSGCVYSGKHTYVEV